MEFHILPTRTAGAAENMAADFLLLQRYPSPGDIRWRHYEWRAPAFTFGFGQKLDWVREQLPTGGPWDLCRRPTGGGMVDHCDDWTYALVIPREHDLWKTRATESYRIVHDCLARALQEQGVRAVVKPPERAESALPGPAPVPGVCFQRAEVYDVIRESDGGKIAGAAQKRNKHGLLFQGSVWKPAAGTVDWNAFGIRFAAELAVAAGVQPRAVPWPDFAEGELDGLAEQYASPEWLGYR